MPRRTNLDKRKKRHRLTLKEFTRAIGAYGLEEIDDNVENEAAPLPDPEEQKI